MCRALPELPFRGPRGLAAQVTDEPVLAQFFGRARHAGVREIFRRRAGDEARGATRLRDEIRRAHLADAHRHVDAFGLHVDVAIVEAHFERDLGITLRELRDGRQQQVLAEGAPVRRPAAGPAGGRAPAAAGHRPPRSPPGCVCNARDRPRPAAIPTPCAWCGGAGGCRGAFRAAPRSSMAMARDMSSVLAARANEPRSATRANTRMACS